jgi:hypothetical protein
MHSLGIMLTKKNMDRKSKSWIDLEPLKVEHGNLERFEDYYARIQQKKEFSHIPKSVFKQWLWAHHDKKQSIQNYGWLDYKNIEFELCTWTNSQLTNIYVIQGYLNYYKNRASYNDFDSFCCIDNDLNEWKAKGTWRTPPIIIDVNSINENIPGWCELNPPFQLVEGHSRLGYLHSMFTIDRLGKGKVAEKHEIYLMRIKNTNA